MNKPKPYNCAFNSASGYADDGDVPDYVERFCPKCSNWKCECNENALTKVVVAKDKTIVDLMERLNDLNDELNRIELAKVKSLPMVDPKLAEWYRCPECGGHLVPKEYAGAVGVSCGCGFERKFSTATDINTFFGVIKNE